MSKEYDPSKRKYIKLAGQILGLGLLSPGVISWGIGIAGEIESQPLKDSRVDVDRVKLKYLNELSDTALLYGSVLSLTAVTLLRLLGLPQQGPKR